MKSPRGVLLSFALAAIAWGSRAEPPASHPKESPLGQPILMPPLAPRHEQRMVDNASDLAKDLAEIVGFLEQGQSYFRAYKKGTHSAEENAAMVKFLETYERERSLAKKEADLLHTWVKTRSDLEPVEEKLEDQKKASR